MGLLFMIMMKIMLFEIATSPLAAMTVTVSVIIAISAIVINVQDTSELIKVLLAIAMITMLALAAIRAFTCSK